MSTAHLNKNVILITNITIHFTNYLRVKNKRRGLTYPWGTCLFAGTERSLPKPVFSPLRSCLFRPCLHPHRNRIKTLHRKRVIFFEVALYLKLKNCELSIILELCLRETRLKQTAGHDPQCRQDILQYLYRTYQMNIYRSDSTTRSPLEKSVFRIWTY